MKINLEYPFNNDWRVGYLRESKKDGRRRVDLINTQYDRTTISYSRYLMSIKLGRYLTSDEEVDHIDTNCANDDIDNLQLLSVDEHLDKTKKENTTGRTMIDIVCPYCKKEFVREKRQVKTKLSFCSKSCSAKYYAGGIA